MDNYQEGGILITFIALVISLIGNVAQYFFPVKRDKIDLENVAALTAKNIAEAYTMTLKSLQEKIEVLEKERIEDKLEIERLSLKVKEQQEEINVLKTALEVLKQASKKNESK